MSTPEYEPNPLDRLTWPLSLTASVVNCGELPPRVHGYDLERDLAPRYDFGETILTVLRGYPPTVLEGKAFNIVLHFLMPAPVNEAPTHAALLARICGGDFKSTLATGAVGLSEQAKYTVKEHEAFLRWLANSSDSFPIESSARTDEERAAVQRFRDALLHAEYSTELFAHPVGRMEALMGVLYELEIRKPEHIESLLVIAKLSTLAAEAIAVAPGSFRKYPLNLPEFKYQET